MKFDFIEFLTENTGPRIPHPEDSIFDGSAAASMSVRALNEVVAAPRNITIKWDGGIALVFGYAPDGEFFCSDKYMYPAGFYAKSPADWERYDTTVKASKQARPDLYPKIAAIWDSLKASVTEKAVFKSDLMASGSQLAIQSRGKEQAFVFKPVTVTYRIPVESKLGKLLIGKEALIVVHLKNNAPWDGKSGIKSTGNVLLIDSNADNTFQLKNPVQLAKAAEQAVAKYGTDADNFLNGLDRVAKDAIKIYFNKKITGQVTQTLPQWLETNISKKQYQLLVGDNNGYLYTNQAGYMALLSIWNAVYTYKVNLVEQLEKQISGFEQYVDGQPAGEGFVVNTKFGLVKLVNRGVFGAAHFGKM